MSTRIKAFAVDCGGFRDWLPRSVADVLFYVAKNAVGEPVFFGAFDAEPYRRYLISKKGGVNGMRASLIQNSWHRSCERGADGSRRDDFRRRTGQDSHR